jgi:Concanavalin A-like lectin/glucanases superfamily/Bacterial Ig-like domain
MSLFFSFILLTSGFALLIWVLFKNQIISFSNINKLLQATFPKNKKSLLKIFPQFITIVVILASFTSNLLPNNIIKIRSEAGEGITSGLRHWYKFDEDPNSSSCGASYCDSALNNPVNLYNQGNAYGSLAFDTAPVPNNLGAVEFYSNDGTDYISNYGLGGSYNSFSYSFWFKAPAGDTGIVDYFVDQGGPGNQHGYYIAKKGQNMVFAYAIRDTYGPSTTLNNIQAAIPDNTSWHQYTVTLDSGVESKIYVDGAPQSTGIMTSNPIDYNNMYGVDAKIGYFQNNGNPVGISGGYDDFRMYSQVLTPADVINIYGDTPNHHYSFDDGAISTIADTGFRNNPGVTNGIVNTDFDAVDKPAQVARNGYSLGFSGTSYVAVDNSTSDPQLPTNAMTLSAWVKPTVYPGTWQKSYIFQIPNGNNYDTSWQEPASGAAEVYGSDELALMINPSGKAELHLFGSSSNTPTPVNYTLKSLSNIALNQWTQITATREGNSAKIYINGVLDNSGTPNSSAGFLVTNNGACSAPIIGGRKPGAPTNGGGSCASRPIEKKFVGKMDDIKLYKYVRSDVDILQEFSGPPPDVAPGTPDMEDASDLGSSNTDDLTSNSTPSFTVSCLGTDVVKLFEGTTLLGTGTCSNSTVTITSTLLSQGNHAITATQNNGFGESVSSVALNITIDTSADGSPGTPDLQASSDTGASSMDNITENSSPTFDIACVDGSNVILYKDYFNIGSGLCIGGIASITSTKLPAGSHNITARQVDLAGNISPASTTLAITILNTPLSVTIDQASMQVDPGSSPVKFTTVFSQPIDASSFDLSDIFLTGTASGKIATGILQVAPNNGTTFEISVNTASAGTVIADIPTGSFVTSSANIASSINTIQPDIILDSAGNAYVADYNVPGTITKITPAGVSSVFASVGDRPFAMTFDSAGNLYSVNYNSETVSKITPLGVVTTLGTTGVNPTDIIIDSLGNVYTSNTGSNNISKITPSGVSSIFASVGYTPRGITIDSFDNIYTVHSELAGFVTKTTPAGVASVFATTGSYSSAITIDSSNNLYVTNQKSNNVTKITPAGVASVFGTTGGDPLNVALDNAGNLYTTNFSSNNVSKITPAGVSTILPILGIEPRAVAVDFLGNIYTSNSGTVTKITETQNLASGVKSLYGTANGTSTSTDNLINVNNNTIYPGGVGSNLQLWLKSNKGPQAPAILSQNNTDNSVLGYQIAQSFTSPADGSLNTIDVYGYTPRSATLKIYDSNGPYGTVLQSQTVDIATGANSFTLSTPLPVISGHVYTFEFNFGGPIGGLNSQSNNPYTGGQGFSNGAGFGIAGDLKFQLGFSGVAVVGSNITSWQDQSGYNRNLTTTISDPALANDKFNFNPSINFDGNDAIKNDNWNANPALISGDKTFTGIAVFKRNSSVNIGTESVYEQSKNELINNNRAGYLTTPATQGYVGAFNDAWDTTPLAQDNPQIAVMTLDNDTIDNLVNYSINGNKSSNRRDLNYSTLNIADNVFSVGASATGGEFLHGDVAEIILYDKDYATSSLEVKKIESYLAVKYGITLDQAVPKDYVATDSTVIWDATANSGYKNNITVIGRDDAQGLIQKQSKSINPEALITVGRGSINADNNANTNTFSVNKSYFAFGDDNGALSWSAVGAPSGKQILGRKFKAQASNYNQTVKITVPDDSSTLTTKLPAEVDALSLMVDENADGSFEKEYPMVYDSVNKLWDPTVTIPTGSVFTFGTTLPATSSSAVASSSTLAISSVISSSLVSSSLLTMSSTSQAVSSSQISSSSNQTSSLAAISSVISSSVVYLDSSSSTEAISSPPATSSLVISSSLLSSSSIILSSSSAVSSSSVAPTLGTYFPLAPLTGILDSSFPNITLNGSNLTDGTLATFIPAGSTTTITGTIISGNFVPNSGSIIPSDSTTGATSGVLKSNGATDLSIPTDFSLPVTSSSSLSNQVSSLAESSSLSSSPSILASSSIIASSSIASPSSIISSSSSNVVISSSLVGSSILSSSLLTNSSGVVLSSIVMAISSIVPVPTNAPFVNQTNGTSVSGNAQPGATIIITNSTGTVVPCTPSPTIVAANGYFICIPTTLPVNGVVLTVTQSTSGSISPGTSITVDSIVPTAPIITGPTNNANLSTTNPVITGIGEPSASIRIQDENGNVVCTTIIPASGAWSCTTGVLVDGSHSLKATQTDLAGNVSDFSITLNIVTTDADGVNVPVEQASPNSGDSNADGIKDYLQSNVAAIPDSVTNKYVVVATDPTSLCQTYNNVSVNTQVQNTVQDSGFDYPVGFVNFTSPCASSVKVKMYWYGLDTSKIYINRKFNTIGQAYSEANGITQTIETVNGVQVVVFTYIITDNGPLDEDSTVGSIKDPIGPAVPKPTVSTNGGGNIIISNGANVSQSIATTTSLGNDTNSYNNFSNQNSDLDSNLTVKEIQSNIETSQKVASSTIRTGGQMSNNFFAISLIIMGTVLLLSTHKKSEE